MKRVKPIITLIGEIQNTSNTTIYAISALAGMLSLLCSPYGFDTQVGETTISVLWSLILPIIVALSYGWKSGLIASLSGGAFFPFLLWPNNGYANLITFSLYTLLFTFLGAIIQKQFFYKKLTYYYQLLLFLIVFGIILNLS